jgi:hypothetical protein
MKTLAGRKMMRKHDPHRLSSRLRWKKKSKTKEKQLFVMYRMTAAVIAAKATLR